MQRRKFRNRYLIVVSSAGFAVAGFVAIIPLPGGSFFVQGLPVSLVLWLMAYRLARMSLTVDATGVVARGIRRTQTAPWENVASFSFESSRVLAGILVVHLKDGGTIRVGAVPSRDAWGSRGAWATEVLATLNGYLNAASHGNGSASPTP